MHVADFEYDLPEALIAQLPLSERGASRLLALDAAGGGLTDRRFADLEHLLRPGDLLVFNDTRVIPARLRGAKSTGGRVEILVERILDPTRALAQVRAGKSLRPGASIAIGEAAHAEVLERSGDFFELRFSHPVSEVLERCGEVPLPPYIRRPARPADRERYQTVYAREPGAVAAPTAGLHFDRDLLERLAAAGVERAFVTLHVGAGTFQPLRGVDLDSHRLHAERAVLSEEACRLVREARSSGRRVVAVGTTTVRVLEAASLHGTIRPLDGEVDLFIRPGFRFRCVDAMITNFHLPRSTLLMLVCAFAGTDRVLAAYRHAVAQGYRFYSYGDCCFVTRGLHEAP